MQRKPLIFFLPSQSVKLANHVALQNLRTYEKHQKAKWNQAYKNKGFTFISYKELDKGLVICETPDLGENQLGAFARKKYLPGDIVTTYDGGPLKNLKDEEVTKNALKKGKDINGIKKIIEKLDVPDDYIWEQEVISVSGEKTMQVVNAEFVGAAGRFVNDSTEPNVELKVINGIFCYVAIDTIPVGKEITTSYGKPYFAGRSYTERKPLDLAQIFSIENDLPAFLDHLEKESRQNVGCLPHAFVTIKKEPEFLLKKPADKNYLNQSKESPTTAFWKQEGIQPQDPSEERPKKRIKK